MIKKGKKFKHGNLSHVQLWEGIKRMGDII